ncbi:MAG TPA: tRNA lysidine(34) synthetase TilS [Capsulimonadaceae bacterium]|jgi:tRNA(Ile)-lysidine synthase
MKYIPGIALIDALQRTIATHRLFSHDDLLVVAVSGGPDSTSLLHALKHLGYKLHAAHLNHGFRGEEAEADAAYVAALCTRLDVPLTSEFRDVPDYKRIEKLSSQVAARQVRYAFLEGVRERVGGALIATAHNQDDRIETMLLNIVRGTGTDGLRGIPYRRRPYVRPLLDVTRDDVEFYCEENHLEPRRDSSNYSAAYARNNVRKELVPYLERRYNESVRGTLLRLSDIAAAESDYLQDVARRWIGGRSFIPVGALLGEPIALQRRIIREYIRNTRLGLHLVDIGHDTIEYIRTMAASPFAVTLPRGNAIVFGDGQTIGLRPPPSPDDIFDINIAAPVGETVAFLKWEVTIKAPHEGANGDPIRVRCWHSGDRIKTLGGTRKLQDVFTDAKIPRDERRQWPVIVDAEGILAVPDLAYAARARSLVLDVKRTQEREEPGV